MTPLNKTLNLPRAVKKNSSTYCDYNDAFKGYDSFRQPHGLRELLEILKQSSVFIREQRVLEGGFGTGAYIDHMRHWVKELYGVEGSDEGYRQARRKQVTQKTFIFTSEIFFNFHFLMNISMDIWSIRWFIILILIKHFRI